MWKSETKSEIDTCKSKKSRFIGMTGATLRSKAESKACYWLLFTFCLIFCFAPNQGQCDILDLSSGKLFSPSVGQRFYDIAYELANQEHITPSQAEQAIILLAAATNLDSKALTGGYKIADSAEATIYAQTGKNILPEIIKLSCQYSQRDRSTLVMNLLTGYVDESTDLEIARTAIRYLLGQLDSREQRETMLEELLRNIEGKNPGLDSEIAASIGMLKAEKADWQAAQYYFMRAFNSNKFNDFAFAKLIELVPDQVDPAMYFEHLRLALSENPLDMQRVLEFAQYAERLQLYKIAIDAYQYCAELFDFLNPSKPLPAFIYLPWAMSCYNTQRNQHKCIQIADRLRQNGQFDLLLEAIAAKALAKIGNPDQAAQMLRRAEIDALDDIEHRLSQESVVAPSQQRIINRQLSIDAERLAWYYCFVSPKPANALDWANKAYSLNPDSATSASILAYALVMNDQTDWARPLISSYEQQPITLFAQAQIQLLQGQKEAAIKSLKSVINSDPGSLEAELANELLLQTGGEYIPPTDPHIVLTVLKNTFGQAIVPEFVGAEKIISVNISARGSKFPYGADLGASIAVTNRFSEPLVISENGLFKGHVRIDADINGDIKAKIPNLIDMRVRPACPLKPGQSVVVPLRLVTGELRKIMVLYPQAYLEIEFTAFLDPVENVDGKLINGIPGIEPVKMLIKRPGVALSTRYLQNRFNSLSLGKQGQKIQTAQLFIGLLLEQNAMANRQPLYKFMYADWMPALLESALMQNLRDSDWIVKTHTLARMLSLPLDYKMTRAVSENLNDENWPVRLMALYMLNKDGGNNFRKVLNYRAKFDSSKLVRDMAIALGGTPPDAEQMSSQPTKKSL